MEDRAVVERQLGRPPRAFHRVVVRCPFGMPAVTEQTPYDDADEPFPTTYYVTCPFLVAAISRLEAAGGVERWSERVATDPELAESLQRATREQRDVRRALAGSQDRPRRRVVARARNRRGPPPRAAQVPPRARGVRPRAPWLRAGRERSGGNRPTVAGNLLHERPRGRGLMSWGPAISSAAVEHARQQWEEGHRRLESRAGERPVYERLHAQVDSLLDELRKRVGQTFTLEQLASVYARRRALEPGRSPRRCARDGSARRRGDRRGCRLPSLCPRRSRLRALSNGQRRTRQRRRPSVIRWGAPIAAAIVLFALGVALGQALEENRRGGETSTSIRTLEPETLPAQTVTVTVTSP